MLINQSELISMYTKYMTTVKNRMYAMESIFNKFTRTEYHETNIGFLAVQLRKILESICYACLVCNDKKYKEIHKKFSKYTPVKDIITRPQEFNPSFFPVHQIIEKATENVNQKRKIAEENPVSIIATRNNLINPLTVQEFPVAYNFSSSIIHTNHPFEEEKMNNENRMENICNYLDKCYKLLDNHITFFPNNRAAICQLNSKDKLVTTGLLNKTSDYVPTL